MIGAFYSPEAAAAAASIVGGIIFLGALRFAVSEIRAAGARTSKERRRMRRELDGSAEIARRQRPGPAKREQERAVIRARMAEIQADTANGIISPLAEREVTA